MKVKNEIIQQLEALSQGVPPTDIALRVRLEEGDDDQLQDAVFRLRDFEQGVRHSYLAVTTYERVTDVPSTGIRLAQHPTRPDDYDFIVKRVTKSSPIEVLLLASSWQTIAVLFAIWVAATRPSSDEVRQLINTILNVPAESLDAFTNLVESLARLVARIRGFQDLVRQASIE